MITNISTVRAMRTVLGWGLATLLLVGLAGCGSGATTGDGPTVVVTSNILGDVVQHLVTDDVTVEVLMPAGVDPHDFAPSARQAVALRDADVVVVNGLGFEAGLQDAIDATAADGVPVVTAAEAIDPLPLAGDEGTEDPHLFTDPVRMRQAAAHLADELARRIPILDAPAARARADAYLDDLDQLDAEIRATLAPIPPARRVLVTNHEVFGYFADRYGFEVLGAIIPGGATLAEPSAADLADLLVVIRDRHVPAIFADTSSPTRLADALAAEGADVAVVDLYSESLGQPGSGADTYVGMMRTDAERIAAALR
jgi:zinc/manganese transport system substrate-binding protein